MAQSEDAQQADEYRLKPIAFGQSVPTAIPFGSAWHLLVEYRLDAFEHAIGNVFAGIRPLPERQQPRVIRLYS